MDSNTRNEDESSSTSSDETSFTFDGRVRDEIPTNVAHLKILSSVDWSFPSYDFLELERLVHNVTFEHGIKTIGDYAFMYCESLREVSIPPTVWIIEAGAFYECGSLVNVELHEGLIEIACEAFACCKSLSHVSIPSTVQTIDDEAFRDCASLCVVSIPSSTETVGERAFAGCESLLAVEFSKEPSLKTLYSSCFDECPALVNVFLPFPIEDIEFLDRDDSSAIANRLASKHADGSPLSRIVNRYAQLPIHKCCYYSSSSTASELENLLKASNDIDNHQNDDFGMSPFHIVATSANLRVDLFQMLLDAYPTDVLSQRDTIMARPCWTTCW
ncbi:unnamed protein product [Cylindrotheca closterium]|uniref:Uncharacterized protein n=1 Tax=Cylindrotheca closterium TaxID=2856 RepID=A0AAD2G5L4_9STRA|nr:unnamed protein product [Cylindrotheca closterium]